MSEDSARQNVGSTQGRVLNRCRICDSLVEKDEFGDHVNGHLSEST